MFLNKLNKEQQDFFIELAACMSSADGVFSDEEKEIIREYENELHRPLDVNFSDGLNLKKVLDSTPEMSAEAKKIIYFELMGLSLCDGSHRSEEAILDDLAERFAISKEQSKCMGNVIIELFKVYKKITDVFTM